MRAAHPAVRHILLGLLVLAVLVAGSSFFSPHIPRSHAQASGPQLGSCQGSITGNWNGSPSTYSTAVTIYQPTASILDFEVDYGNMPYSLTTFVFANGSILAAAVVGSDGTRVALSGSYSGTEVPTLGLFHFSGQAAAAPILGRNATGWHVEFTTSSAGGHATLVTCTVTTLLIPITGGATPAPPAPAAPPSNGNRGSFGVVCNGVFIQATQCPPSSGSAPDPVAPPAPTPPSPQVAPPPPTPQLRSCGSPSQSCGTPGIPDIPTALRATAIDGMNIRLDWAIDSNYGIWTVIEEYYTNRTIGYAAGNVTSFLVQNLSPNTQYCFRVYARGNSGSSDSTDPVCATTFAASPATAGSVDSWPSISRINIVVPDQYQTITLWGSNFGSQNEYDGDSPYIEIEDTTAGWRAGWSNDSEGPNHVHLHVIVWNDTQIAIFGLTNGYGTNGWYLNVGDQVVIRVWNPQTGHGSATFTTKVLPNVPQFDSALDPVGDAIQGCVSGLVAGTDIDTAAMILNDLTQRRWLDAVNDLNPYGYLVDCATTINFLLGGQPGT